MSVWRVILLACGISLQILLFSHQSFARSVEQPLSYIEGSAKRDPNVSAWQIIEYVRTQMRLEEEGREWLSRRRPTGGDAGAVNRATDSNLLDTASIPQTWRNTTDLQKEFQNVRDSRIFDWTIPNTTNIHFLRRITWLYPDDGCFWRGESVINFFEKRLRISMRKIFVFGDLAMRTNLTKYGQVTWWYHVAPATRIGTNTYILDPAVEPKVPLLIQDWVTRINIHNDPGLRFVVCDSHTYIPSDRCMAPDQIQNDELNDNAKTYLDLEWVRLKSLKRDPYVELGATPPWTK